MKGGLKMNTKKRRLEALSFYDHTGIEKHLADMARKGWMIEQISNYYWTYRKIEPQELKFTVTYFPKANDFDPAPSEAQQTLMDFCADTGWELACTWFQMQIFYNTADNPTPINTDPALEVDTIHRACKAQYLRSYKILSVIGLIGSFFFVSSLISDTLRLIASPSDLMTGTIFLALFLLCTRELIAYYTWHRKAKRAAEHEMFLDTPSTAAFQKTVLAILLPFVMYWLVNLAFGRDPLMAWIAVMVLSAIFGTTVLVNAVKRLLKKKGASSGVNKILTTISSFVIAFILMSVVISAGVYISKGIPKEELLYGGDIPLKVEDLMSVDYSDYIIEHSPDESLLLTRLEIDQRHGFDDEASPEIPELNYEIYIVKVPELYGFCENQMKRLIVLSASWNGELVEGDGASWGADRAYRLVMDDGTEKDVYLLCYADRLVRIEFNWTPTQDQMSIVGRQLKGN